MECFEKWLDKIEKLSSYIKIYKSFNTSWSEWLIKANGTWKFLYLRMKKSCTHNTMRDQKEKEKEKKSWLLSSVSFGLILQHANYGTLTSQPVHV